MDINRENIKKLSKEEIIDIIELLSDKTQKQEELILDISHDLRNSINIILSILKCVERDCKNKDSKIKEYRKLIRKNSLKMVKLLNNLIDNTKMEGEYYKLNMENVDIINIVEGTVESIRNYAQEKDISILFDTNVEEYIMSVDVEAIDRIVINLLSNAIKFSARNTQIYVNIIVNDESIDILVKDNGIGIKKEDQDRIFERFSQAHIYKIQDNCGSGIGLQLVKNLTHLHGGEVLVKSESGLGSTFTIKLPVEVIKEEVINNKIESHSKVERLELEFSDIYF